MLTTRRADHQAAVLGSPVAHSLSPALHNAAYAALGLDDWHYGATEMEAADLVAHVEGLDDAWAGLSLTMPLKEVAFEVAAQVDQVALATRAINTLVRGPAGWSGANTDVHGIRMALNEAGVESVTSALVLGSGATARSAVAALAGLSARRVTFMVRGRARAATVEQAAAMGLEVRSTPFGTWPDTVELVVNTAPPAATRSIATDLPAGRALLEVTYGDGATPLMSAASARGYAVVPGTQMLLHQAAEQVRLMTGCPAPLTAMRQALDDALSPGCPTSGPSAASGPSATPAPSET